jgi:hypothetical protein
VLDLTAVYVQHPDRTLRPGQLATAVEARPTRRPGWVGAVGFHDQGGAAGLVDLGGEASSRVPAAGHQRHGGAVLGEPAGGGGADAAAGAGDQRGGPGQVRSHG